MFSRWMFSLMLVKQVRSYVGAGAGLGKCPFAVGCFYGILLNAHARVKFFISEIGITIIVIGLITMPVK